MVKELTACLRFGSSFQSFSLQFLVLLVTCPFKGEVGLGGLPALIYADSLFLFKGRVKGYVLLCLTSHQVLHFVCLCFTSKNTKHYYLIKHTYTQYEFQTFTNH